jgi:hypothetical protein
LYGVVLFIPEGATGVKLELDLSWLLVGSCVAAEVLGSGGNPGADVDVLPLKLAYKFVHTLGLPETPKPSVSGMELRNAFWQETARPGSRDQQLTITQASPSPAADRTPRFDPGVAHPARVYDVWLGGKDGLAADRKAAEEVAAHRPQVVAGARANRAFLARAVRYLAGQRGVRQFIDIGPGLPAPAIPTR